MKNKIHNEDELLKMFCDESRFRSGYHKPFLNEKYNEVWATDGRILIRIPPERLSEKYETRTLTLQTSLNKIKKEITLPSLEKALSDCPQEEEEIIVDKEKECEECDGYGEVYWEYNDNSGYCHTETFHCPVCNGSGISEKETRKKTGRVFASADSIVKIDQSYFKAKYIHVLKKAMEHLEANVAEITLNGINGLAQIDIDDVRIILSPIIKHESMKFHAEVKLK